VWAQVSLRRMRGSHRRIAAYLPGNDPQPQNLNCKPSAINALQKCHALRCRGQVLRPPSKNEARLSLHLTLDPISLALTPTPRTQPPYHGPQIPCTNSHAVAF